LGCDKTWGTLASKTEENGWMHRFGQRIFVIIFIALVWSCDKTASASESEAKEHGLARCVETKYDIKINYENT